MICPHCQADLSAYTLSRSRCPACGDLLANHAPDEQTASPVGIESQDSLETLQLQERDSTGRIETVDGDDNMPEPPSIDVTLASFDLSEFSEQGKSRDEDPAEQAASIAKASGGTASVDEVLRTLDPERLSGDAARTFQTMWAQEAIPDQQESSSRRQPDAVSRLSADSDPAPDGLLARHAARIRPAVAGDYDIQKRLGEGGMGIVYHAHHRALDRDVALKTLKKKRTLDRRTVEKFLSEALVMADLDHPNILPIYDVGRDETGNYYYVMKLIRGTPWMHVIRDKSLTNNLEILLHVTDGVAYAHSVGVVHRDLKPENVMLGEFGEVYVLDWGLALLTSKSRKLSLVGMQTSMGGTPAYMAPEMATGPVGKIGPASDVYLLGAILYEIITGVPPHTGRNVMKCLMAAARNQIRPTEQSGRLIDIALRAMATDPADRFADVQSFQQAIRDYQTYSESTGFSARSNEELIQAVKEDDYLRYARAMFGFEEALALWEGNEPAREGLAASRIVLCRSAMYRGDYSLARALAHQFSQPDVDLNNELAIVRRADQRERELRSGRRIKLALTACTPVITALVAWVIWILTRAALA